MEPNVLKPIQFSVTTVGRRKSAVAIIQLCKGTGEIIINGKPALFYTQGNDRAMFAIEKAHSLLSTHSSTKQQNVYINVKGGGIIGQAFAIQLGIARALLKLDPESKSLLNIDKLLTCDSRIKERKKYGLKKARKAPQFSKR